MGKTNGQGSKGINNEKKWYRATVVATKSSPSFLGPPRDNSYRELTNSRDTLQTNSLGSIVFLDVSQAATRIREMVSWPARRRNGVHCPREWLSSFTGESTAVIVKFGNAERSVIDRPSRFRSSSRRFFLRIAPVA